MKTIGHIEQIDLVEFGITNVPCKIDTGADTSAIHCERVRIKVVDGKEWLAYKLFDPKHPFYSGKEILTDQFKEKKVKSSFGDYEFRYQVKMRVKFFNRRYVIAFNLSNRKNMKFPILLGKRFLNKKFLVDVSKHNLSLKKTIKKSS
jgi:hypothetical protein